MAIVHGEEVEVLVEFLPSLLVVNLLGDLSLPVGVAVSDFATGGSDGLLANHHSGSTVGADMLESLVPAVASVKAEETTKESAEWVTKDTVSCLDWNGVDEVAAVTAWKSLNRLSSEGLWDVAEVVWQDTAGSHSDDVGLVLATFILGIHIDVIGLDVHAGHWSHLWGLHL